MKREINKEMGTGLATVMSGTSPIMASIPGSTDYSTTTNVIFDVQRIDLGGVAVKDKTVFFDNVGLQYSGPYRCSNEITSGTFVREIVFVSSTPYGTNHSALDTAFLTGDTYGYGFLGSEIDRHSVIFGQVTTHTFTADIQAATDVVFQVPMVVTAQNTFGSMTATASDTLYMHRIIEVLGHTPGTSPPPRTPKTITIPAMRFVAAINVEEEAEYQYMMRLKNSYELQNQPDIDKA
tara:strand:- start:1572 stop:2279 length:708 start_codon:yes stop_codon:yes gene_type:complete